MPYAEIEGERLFFQDWAPADLAKGRPVVLLHGLGANSASWAMQTNTLIAAGWRCLAIDLPGFGNSPYRKDIVAPGDMASLTARFIQDLRLAPSHIVGVSLGGMVALELGIQAPEAVSSLTLVSTASNLRPVSPAIALYYGLRFVITLALGKDLQARLVARRIFPETEQELLRRELQSEVRQADARAYRRTLLSLVHFDVRGRLSGIKGPVLVVTGGRDTTIPAAKQYELASRIDPWRHEVFPQAGHALNIEQPDQFNALLLEFLDMYGG